MSDGAILQKHMAGSVRIIIDVVGVIWDGDDLFKRGKLASRRNTFYNHYVH